LNLSGLIPIAGGIFGLLAVFGVVSVSRNPQANEQWLQKYGAIIKIISPLAILVGLAQLFGLFP